MEKATLLEEDTNGIFNRLHLTPTVCTQARINGYRPERTPKVKKGSDEEDDDPKDINEITLRLYLTKTKSSIGQPCKIKPTVAEDIITAHKLLKSNSVIKKVSERLHRTETRSSKSRQSLEVDHPLGAKTRQEITEEERFKGCFKVSKEESKDIFYRLQRAHTQSSHARREETAEGIRNRVEEQHNQLPRWNHTYIIRY